MKEIVVILHNIRSLYNVGSFFRTADAAGCQKIYLTGITPTPIDVFNKPRQQLTKVSLGAEKYVKWQQMKSATKLLKKLKKEGYEIFCVEQNKESIPYYKIKTHNKQKIALILGNEIKGLSLAILKNADKILEIPMKGKKESLNVSIAFGIVIFHLINN
ncbi:TrmH family RNA methyltransferase [Candidatus Wolfebacteria bacterium]|nr:TrmH family RNA methyltransferase [Candidatus Wolfebacteria bacterium]